MSAPRPSHLQGRSLENHWRMVTVAGALGGFYFACCVGGVARVEFLNRMGATAWHFGVIASLGSLALAFQLLSGVLANHLARRKPIWMVLSIAHRVVFLLVLLAPTLFVDPRWRMLWIVAALFLHDAMMHLVAPMWFSWMTELLPPDAANRYWGKRQRTTTLLNIGAAIGIFVYLKRIETGDSILPGLIGLMVFGIVMGVVDILLFLPIPEPPHERSRGESFWKTVVQPLRDREFRPFLIFSCYWHFSAACAFPFFGPYMIQQLGFNPSTAQIVMVTSALGVAISSRFWGLLCDSYGKRPVLQLVVSFKTTIVVAFLIVPHRPSIAIPILAVAFFIDGILNSGFMLSSMGLKLQATPKRNRTMYIAASTFFSMGIAGAVASFLGGQLAEWAKDLSVRWGPYHITSYHVPFALSFLLRFNAMFVARRIREKRGMPVGTLLSHLRATNPARVSALVYRLLESPWPARRARAARRLGDLASPLAIGGLIAALGDGEKTVRRAAAHALGRIGSGDATDALARVLEDRARGIQSTAAYALGRISDGRSVRALLENLRSLDPRSLAQAVDALRRLGDSAAILPLVCLLEEVQDRALQRKIERALAALSTTGSAAEVMSMFRAERERRTRV